MTLSELLESVRANPQAVTVPAVWSQGRSCFGGLMAALQLEAMRVTVGADRPVRSLAISFIGPTEIDVPISFEVQTLREGRAVTQVLGRAVQNGETLMLIQGSFGAPRESLIAVSAEPAPQFKPVDEAPEFPFVAGAMPEYLRYIDMRWALGAIPYSNTRSRAIGGYARLHDVAQERLTEAHLLVLADTWPPAVLAHLSKPAPGSSLTWTIEFIQPLPQMTTLDWTQYHAVIEHARDGYGHVAAGLWSPRGELIAISRQTVTVFG